AIVDILKGHHHGRHSVPFDGRCMHLGVKVLSVQSLETLFKHGNGSLFDHYFANTLVHSLKIFWMNKIQNIETEQIVDRPCSKISHGSLVAEDHSAVAMYDDADGSKFGDGSIASFALFEPSM